MPTPPIRTTTGFTDLYALFHGTSIAVAATEGTSLNACWYSASDSAVAAKTLPAGIYDGVYLHGNVNSPSASDPEEGVFDGFNWDGTTSTTADTELSDMAGGIAAANDTLGQLFTNVGGISSKIGTPAETLADDIAAVSGSGVVVPVNQVPVPSSRTWILKDTDDGLAGEIPLVRHAGETNQVFAIDWRNDLATNGRLVSVDSVTIISGLDGGITISSADNDTGVDRSQSKHIITLTTPGTYVIEVAATYDHGEGIATVTLNVT